MRKNHQLSLNDKTAFRKYKRKIFQNISCTHGRMCLYGCYAPEMVVNQLKAQTSTPWVQETFLCVFQVISFDNKNLLSL